MAKRRTSSEGSLYQLPSGNWRAQVCIDGRRISATRRTKVAAREWISEITAQAAQGLSYQAAQTTLGEFIAEWITIKQGHIRPATLELYQMIIRLYIVPRIGRFKLIEMTGGAVQAWIDKLGKDKIGIRTVQLAQVILHGCLKHAVMIGLLLRNPAAAVLLPKRERKAVQVWTESQVSQFLISVKGERNEILYHLALATGMRQGELLGLMWADIDWIGGRIQVVRQATERKGGGYEFSAPKSERGRRSIEIGPGVMSRLRVQALKVHELRRHSASWVENDLVFPSVRGTPQEATNLIRDFKRLVQRSGLPAIRFHDLRHTAATLMLSHGIPAVIVAGMLGHTLSVLMDTYSHFIPSMQSQAAALMDELTAPVEFEKALK